MLTDFNRYNKNEKYNDVFNAKEIYIILYNKNELDLFFKRIDLKDFKLSDYIINNDRITYPIYLFINLKTMRVLYSEIGSMRQYQDITQYSTFDGVWNKLLTIKDLTLIDNIVKHKNVNVNPDYKPKEKPKRLIENIINENHFNDNDEILNYSKNKNIPLPSIKIDNIVYIKPNYLELLKKLQNKYDVFISTSTLKYINDNLNKKYKVLHKFKYDENIDSPWWSMIGLNENDKNEIWVYDELLIYQPQYDSKEKPKRLLENKLNEGYFFDTNSEILNYSKKYDILEPNFKIGDIVFVKNNYIELLKKLELYNNINIDKISLQFIKNNTHKKFKILEKYKSNKNSSWMSKIDIYDRNEIWVFDDILYNHPQYDSKQKPKRILENNIVDNQEIYLNESNGKYSHRSIVIEINNLEELSILQKFLKQKEYLFNVPRTDIIFPNYIFIENFKKYDNDDNDLKLHLSYLSNSPSYEKLLHYIDYNQKVFKIKDLQNIHYIISTGYDMPLYLPKEKPKRILESNQYKYSSVVFKINNDKENEIAQKTLFENGFHWMSNKNIRTFYNHNYPIYLFAEANYKLLTFGYGMSSILNYIKDCNGSGDNICESIFDYDKTKYVIDLLKYGNIPIYHSKEKPKRILESFQNLSNKYNYNCIVIKINNINEYNHIYNILKLNNIDVSDIEYNLPNYIEDGYISYIRIYDNGGTLKSSGNMMINLEEYSKDAGFIYNKIYDAKNIKDQSILNILNYGDDIPNYKPKQKLERTFESNKFKYSAVVFKVKNEEENEIAQNNLIKFNFKWEYPFSIRKFKSSYYPVYIFAEIIRDKLILNYINEYDDDSEILNYIKSCNDMDENICEHIFNYDDTMFVNDILINGHYRPNYRPKERFKRTFESYNNYNIEHIKKLLNNSPFDVIYYRHHNNTEYCDKFNEILKKYPFFDKGYDGDIEYDDMFGKNYFFTLKNIENWEQFKIYQSEQGNDEIFNDYPNIKFSDMIVNPNHLDKVLSNLTGKLPNYQSKEKPKRLIESNKNELIKEMWQFIRNDYDMDLITNRYNTIKPKYKIGDEIRFKKNALEIHISQTKSIYQLENHQKLFITQGIINNSLFTIKGFAYWKHTNLWLIQIDEYNFISVDACINKEPDYTSSKKIKREL